MIKILEIRDNPKFGDRYTVVYDTIGNPSGDYESLGMNAEPFHPQGIGQHGAAQRGDHLGTLITFDDLPADCQQAVIMDLEYDPRTTNTDTDERILGPQSHHIYDLRTEPLIQSWYLRQHSRKELLPLALHIGLTIKPRTSKPELIRRIKSHMRTLAYIRNKEAPHRTATTHWYAI